MYLIFILSIKEKMNNNVLSFLEMSLAKKY